MKKNWAEIRRFAGEYAKANLLSGMNCAESVFEACIRSGALELPPDSVACATGFGGGAGCSGFTCGALSAAILVNSSVYGRKSPSEVPDDIRRKELRERIYKRYNHIVSDFVKESGSGLCREIIENYDSYFDPEARSNCARICGIASQIAVDYLQISEDDVKNFEYDMSVINIKGWSENPPII